MGASDGGALRSAETRFSGSRLAPEPVVPSRRESAVVFEVRFPAFLSSASLSPASRRGARVETHLFDLEGFVAVAIAVAVAGPAGQTHPPRRLRIENGVTERDVRL